MTEDYFEFSQQVKREVKADSGLMAKLRGYYVRGEKGLQDLGGGAVNIHYRVGKTESGMWIAIRDNRLMYEMTPEEQAEVYNSYCEEAEGFANIGKGVPKFCIGILTDKRAGLLVEDITQGGEWKIKCGDGNYVTIVNGNDVKRIKTDLIDDMPNSEDFDFDEVEINIELLKYFRKGARIDL